jgi:hypothetical protein
MARVPKVGRKKIFLARGIFWYPNLFRQALLYNEEHKKYVYTSAGVEIGNYKHYNQLMLRVYNLLYKPEAVRSYCFQPLKAER